MLFRAFCCLCNNRQSLPNINKGGGYYYYQDDSDDDSEDEYTDAKVQARVVELSNLKRNAIDATTDVIVAEDLLRRHGNDSSLLMYHNKCSEGMYRALDKLPLTSRGLQATRPYSSRKGAPYTRHIV